MAVPDLRLVRTATMLSKGHRRIVGEPEVVLEACVDPVEQGVVLGDELVLPPGGGDLADLRGRAQRDPLEFEGDGFSLAAFGAGVSARSFKRSSTPIACAAMALEARSARCRSR